MIDVHLYMSNSDFQKQATRNVISKYGHLIQWNHGASIMDLGCGDGSTTADILMPMVKKHLQEFSLCGIDLLDTMITMAKETSNEVDFFQLDITTDDLDSSMADAHHNIFSFFCLHLIGNYRNWIRNIYSMLKPGGQIFLLLATENPLCAEIVKQSKDGRWAKYMKCAGDVAGTPFTLLSNPSDWISNLLIEYKYKNVICEKTKEIYVFRNTEKLKAFIKSFKVLYQDMPKDIVDDFLDKFTDLVGNGCHRIAGKPEYYFECSLLLLIANK